MNRHIEHAWDRHIDHGLRELHGEAAPDYTDAVLARLGDDQRRAEPSRPRIWPTAAALLGAAIVGILLMLDPGRSPAAARDWFESLRQHRVSTLEQFAALPPDARRLMLSTSDDAVIDTLLGALVRREAEFDRPRLVDLWIGDDAFIDARDLGDLARLPGLERLSIELAPTVDADALRQLAALPKLRTLFLRSCILTSEQLEVLAEFAALDGLRLAFTETEPRSPDSLRFLRRLPKLQLLDVAHSWQLATADFERLRHLRDLRDLSIDSCNGAMGRDVPGQFTGAHAGVTDATLRMIGAMPTLTRLQIGGLEAITNDGLAALGALPNLRVVDISNSRSELDWTLLPTGLHELVAHAAHLGVDALARQRELRWLWLNRPQLSAADWRRVDVSHLRSLTLTQVDRKRLPAELFGRCTELRDLTLWGDHLDDAHFEQIGTLPKLDHLTLAVQTLRGDQLRHLADLTSLRRLELMAAKLEPDASALEPLRRLPLREVAIGSNLTNGTDLLQRLRELWPAATVEAR